MSAGESGQKVRKSTNNFIAEGQQGQSKHENLSSLILEQIQRFDPKQDRIERKNF
jgi:hypothetical protein